MGSKSTNVYLLYGSVLVRMVAMPLMAVTYSSMFFKHCNLAVGMLQYLLPLIRLLVACYQPAQLLDRKTPTFWHNFSLKIFIADIHSEKAWSNS